MARRKLSDQAIRKHALKLLLAQAPDNDVIEQHVKDNHINRVDGLALREEIEQILYTMAIQALDGGKANEQTAIDFIVSLVKAAIANGEARAQLQETHPRHVEDIISRMKRQLKFLQGKV